MFKIPTHAMLLIFKYRLNEMDLTLVSMPDCACCNICYGFQMLGFTFLVQVSHRKYTKHVYRSQLAMQSYSTV